jgi:hypothetical protein
MNEFAIKPPEDEEWNIEFISKLTTFIQAIKFAPSGTHSFYTRGLVLELASTFDLDFAKMILGLSGVGKLSGLVHIYKRHTDESPTASILPTSPSLTVFRNV